MNISANLVSIREIFQFYPIEIPQFQRNYAWEKDNVERLFETFAPAYMHGDHDPIFLGPITSFNAEGGTNNGKLQLIDGQQRLTTFLMIFYALRNICEALADDSFFDSVGNEILLRSKFQEVAQGIDGQPRVKTNYQINAAFQKYIASPPKYRIHNSIPDWGKRGANLSARDKANTTSLRSAWFHILETLQLPKWIGPLPSEIDDIEKFKKKVYKFFQIITDQCFIVRIIVDSYDSAFDLFESLNDTGVELTQSDLVKSFLLGKIFTTQISDNDDARFTEQEKWLDEWDDAVSNLTDAKADFSDFLRHYLIATTGSRVTNKKIFRSIKDSLKEDNQGHVPSPESVVRSIHSNSENYKKIIKGLMVYGSQGPHKLKIEKEVNAALRRLTYMGSTYRILLLTVLNQNLEPQIFVDLVKSVEALASYLLINGVGKQDIENIWTTASKEILDSNSKSDAVKLITRGFIERIQNLNLENFKNLSTNRDLANFVLRKLQWHVANIEPDNDLTIEHLAPQNPGETSKVYWHAKVGNGTKAGSATYDELVASWGNLTLLEMELQIEISNHDWSRKITTPGLPDSKVGIANELIKLTDWDENHIIRRENWILARFSELISPNYLKSGEESISKTFLK